jgi:phosphotransacetylase
MYRTFRELVAACSEKLRKPKRLVVAGAEEEHVLEAVFLAREKGLVVPLLVGEQRKVKELIQKMGHSLTDCEIVPCSPGESPSEVAVKLLHAGSGDYIMKGKIGTKDFLRPILDRETGLNKKGFITHFGLMQLKGYHKLLAISDCAVIPYPTFEEKKKILRESLEVLRKLGYTRPVVGVLCAVETVNEKMPETVDAQRLQELAMKGEFGDVVVVGPISYDLATRKESARIKGYDSPYAGEVDMLLVPNLVTGNVMSKIWNADSENIMAGCLIGADVPIALTSRSASMSEKLHSILLCNLLS